MWPIRRHQQDNTWFRLPLGRRRPRRRRRLRVNFSRNYVGTTERVNELAVALRFTSEFHCEKISCFH